MITIIKHKLTHLQVGRTMVQQLEHVFDILGILDDKVELHVKLSADQLQRKGRERESGCVISILHHWPKFCCAKDNNNNNDHDKVGPA